MHALLDADKLALLEDDHLEMKQAKFVKYYVRECGDAEAAFFKAGYEDRKYVTASVNRLLNNPKIRLAIQREREMFLTTDTANLATRKMRQFMTDPDVPHHVQFSAARWVLEGAGHGLAAKQALLGLPSADKPLSEMSIEDLSAFVERGKQALDNIKNVTPIEASSVVVETSKEL